MTRGPQRQRKLALETGHTSNGEEGENPVVGKRKTYKTTTTSIRKTLGGKFPHRVPCAPNAHLGLLRKEGKKRT